jgi:hypothetical protein
MRLINTETLELEDSKCRPQYAILSHTWGADEVLFDVVNGTADRKYPSLNCSILAPRPGKMAMTMSGSICAVPTNQAAPSFPKP